MLHDSIQTIIPPHGLELDPQPAVTSQTKSKTESLHMGRISPRKNKNISIKNVVTLPATKKYTTETETFHTGLDIPSSECPSLCQTPLH